MDETRQDATSPLLEEGSNVSATRLSSGSREDLEHGCDAWREDRAPSRTDDQAWSLDGEEATISLQEPLLPGTSDCSPKGCTILDGVLNMVNATIGCGVMALPLVVAKLGLLFGTLSIVVCGLICVYCLQAIVWTSVVTNRRESYGDLVCFHFGLRGGQSLQLAVALANAGLLVVYLIMIADVMVGQGDIKGVLPAALGLDGGDDAPWYCSRTVIILVVALLQAPLCFLPSLHSLTRASLLATLGAIGFVVATVALSVAASAEGIVPPLHVMPDKALLGAGSGGGFGRVAMGVLQSLPVSLTAYGNQYNVHPVMAELRPGRGGVLRRMEAVIWAAALICAAAYAALGAAGYSLFGQEVQGDLLANFGEESLGPILGGSAGAWFGAVAKAVYAGTLVVTFPVCNWGLRVNALELVSETPPGPGSAVWNAFTAGTVAATTALAIFTPSIDIAIEFIGATAGVLVSFVWPMMLLYKVKRDRGELDWATRLLIGVIITLGLLVTVVGVGGVFSI